MENKKCYKTVNMETNSCILFKRSFFKYIEDENIDAHEFTESVIDDVLNKFFSIEKYTDAESYIYNFTSDYTKADYFSINFKLEDDELKKSFEYINWKRDNAIKNAAYTARNESGILYHWVKLHGKVHTDEEAASIAANKWGELLFKHHIQDNGDLDSEHSFKCSLLSTYLGDTAKEKISDEIKQNVIKLFKDFYLANIKNDIEWCQKNLTDTTGKFKWLSMHDPNSDYHPNYPLYLILLHGGVPENLIDDICPWKTGITIRPMDNTVFYNTYAKREEI